LKYRRLKLGILVCVSVVAVGLGLLNAALLKSAPIDVAYQAGKVIIERINANSSNSEARPGDILSEISGRQIHSLTDARWELERAGHSGSIDAVIQRDGRLIPMVISSDRPVPAVHILITLMVGCVFLFIGLFVWYSSQGDSVVAAFLRLNLLTGIAVLLDSQRTAFDSAFAQHGYSIIWLFCYILIPPACLDFVLRFTVKRYPSRIWYPLAVYLFPAALMIALSGLYISATASQASETIAAYDVGLRFVFALILAVYFVASLAFLLYSVINASKIRERGSSRWLLLCTIIGVSPFVILHKLPTLWGGFPMISADLALGFLLISPIGWAMAVASFRLLPIEITLSRTFIYVTSGAIAVYGMLILISFGAGDGNLSLFSVIALALVALFITFLAGLSLVKGIRSVVDRVYFGDWYSYRDEVQDLSQKLAGSILERDISAILSEELPELLHIEKVILLIRDNFGNWMPLVQRDAPLAAEFREAIRDLDTLLVDDTSASAVCSIPQTHPLAIWGIDIILPLIHAKQILGCLLMGRKESHAPYSTRDFQLLRTLSPFAGLAIANLKLHRELVARECRAVAADLAGGISHEINNALYPLKGQAQLIQHSISDSEAESLNPQLAQSTKMIIEMSNKIQRISDNLNHLAEPIRPKKILLNLNEIAEEAIAMLSETAGRIKKYNAEQSAAFRLRRDYSEDLPRIEADPGQMNQVFINLILNAADAMEKNAEGTLTIGTFVDPEGAAVCGFVEDTGIGIPAERLKDIFLPYFTTKAEGKGTGLGLAIVHAIIEGHEGSVRIKSNPGKGTRIEIAIPIAATTLSMSGSPSAHL